DNAREVLELRASLLLIRAVARPNDQEALHTSGPNLLADRTARGLDRLGVVHHGCLLGGSHPGFSAAAAASHHSRRIISRLDRPRAESGRRSAFRRALRGG